MTWTEMENFVQRCIDDKLTEEQLKGLMALLPYFDSCNFKLMMKERGIAV